METTKLAAAANSVTLRLSTSTDEGVQAMERYRMLRLLATVYLNLGVILAVLAVIGALGLAVSPPERGTSNLAQAAAVGIGGLVSGVTLVGLGQAFQLLCDLSSEVETMGKQTEYIASRLMRAAKAKE